MKCERLVPQLCVVCDNGSELILEADREFSNVWYLHTEEDHYITVSEIYDIAKSVLECSDEQTVRMVTVEVLDSETTINRQTTKEEYFMNIIGDESCNASIE